MKTKVKSKNRTLQQKLVKQANHNHKLEKNKQEIQMHAHIFQTRTLELRQ
jgi:hypothetical protein